MRTFRIITASLIVAAILALILFFGQILNTLAEKVLEKAIPGSRVSVTECVFRPAGSLYFRGISIEKSGAYSVFVNEAEIRHKKGFTLKASDVNVNLTLPRNSEKSIAEFFPRQGVLAKAPLLRSVDLSRALVRISTRDVLFEGLISFDADLEAKEVKTINVKVFSLDTAGIKVKNAFLTAAGGTGTVGAEEVRYGRMFLADLSGKARLEGRTLAVEDINGKVFDGTVTGNLKLVISSIPKYAVSLTARGLQMAEVVKELKVSDKVDMTGSVGGIMNVAGLGKSLTEVTGSFLSDASGGKLVVNDEDFFRAIAERTKQPLDIIKGSFKDYKFEKGKVELFSEGNDLVMLLYLKGEQGERNIRVTVHDFNSQEVEK